MNKVRCNTLIMILISYKIITKTFCFKIKNYDSSPIQEISFKKIYYLTPNKFQKINV